MMPTACEKCSFRYLCKVHDGCPDSPKNNPRYYACTHAMASQRIAELEREKEQLWKDYCDKKVEIESEIEQLQKAISNESVLHEVT